MILEKNDEIVTSCVYSSNRGDFTQVIVLYKFCSEYFIHTLLIKKGGHSTQEEMVRNNYFRSFFRKFKTFNHVNF